MMCQCFERSLVFILVNESSAEFGNTKIPGVLGTDYTWPSPSSVDYFMGECDCNVMMRC
jgi:endoglucanase